MPRLISPERAVAVVAPVDMRLGADGLSLKLQALGANPFDGCLYLFTNKQHNRLKALAWDGNGVWLCQRRLHRGHFIWPKLGEACFSLTPTQWEWLVAGVDWRRLENALPDGARL